MMSLKVARAEVRRAREVLGAARMIGDSEAVKDAAEVLELRLQDLAVLVVKDFKDGVSKGNVAAGKPPVVSKGHSGQR